MGWAKRNRKRARSTASGAVTDVELVAAPTSTQKIVVFQVYISADAVIPVIFESSTATEVWSQFVGSNAGSVVPDTDTAWFECIAGESLTYTHPAGANTSVSVYYEIENV